MEIVNIFNKIAFAEKDVKPEWVTESEALLLKNQKKLMKSLVDNIIGHLKNSKVEI